MSDGTDERLLTVLERLATIEERLTSLAVQYQERSQAILDHIKFADDSILQRVAFLQEMQERQTEDHAKTKGSIKALWNRLDDYPPPETLRSHLEHAPGRDTLLDAVARSKQNERRLDRMLWVGVGMTLGSAGVGGFIGSWLAGGGA